MDQERMLLEKWTGLASRFGDKITSMRRETVNYYPGRRLSLSSYGAHCGINHDYSGFLERIDKAISLMIEARDIFLEAERIRVEYQSQSAGSYDKLIDDL